MDTATRTQKRNDGPVWFRLTQRAFAVVLFHAAIPIGGTASTRFACCCLAFYHNWQLMTVLNNATAQTSATWRVAVSPATATKNEQDRESSLVVRKLISFATAIDATDIVKLLSPFHVVTTTISATILRRLLCFRSGGKRVGARERRPNKWRCTCREESLKGNSNDDSRNRKEKKNIDCLQKKKSK